jgi:hypothetical protein
MLKICRWRPIFGYFMRTIVAFWAICASILLASLNGSTAGPEVSTHASLVNRSHKGDRLSLVSTIHLDSHKRSQQNTPAAVARELPEGCESAVSPIVDRHLARIASRCIS